MPSSLLIIDSDVSFRSELIEQLRAWKFIPTGISSLEEAISLLDQFQYDLIFVYFRTVEWNTPVFLDEIRRKNPTAEIIAIQPQVPLQRQGSLPSGGSLPTNGAYCFKSLEDVPSVTALIQIVTKKHSLERKRQKLIEALQAKSLDYVKVLALSVRDGLTDLYNQRSFLEMLRMEVLRSTRYEYPISLLFMDLDHFKNYNDTNGHPKGSEALKQIAILIQKRVRVTDIVCRYGGDEFLVLLPYTQKSGAQKVAVDMQRIINQAPIENYAKQPGGMMTISIGISEYPADIQTGSEDWVRITDETLYRAKQSGKNNICLYTKTEKTS